MSRNYVPITPLHEQNHFLKACIMQTSVQQSVGADPKIVVNHYKGKPVVETLTNGYFIVDKQWIVKYWNKAAEQLTHVPEKDIIGKNLWEHFASTLPVEFYSVYDKAFLINTPVHFREYWPEMGRWFDIITWHTNNTLCVSFKSSHLSYPEYPESQEQRLKTLTELYKYVTEITNDCLWEWDFRTSELFWIDGGHKRVFGYPVENALVPESFWESCIHPDDRVRVIAGLEKIKTETTNLWEIEYRFKKLDGKYLYVHDRAHILYDDDGIANRMIGATQDINDKVLLEHSLVNEKKANQRALTAAWLSAQEEERAVIGKELHDNLGQILAVAKMYLQMAKKSPENREAWTDKSLEFIMEVMAEIRKISKTLVIPSTHIIGLFDNIKNLLKDVTNADPLKIEFLSDSIQEDELSDSLQLTIYRIVQEQVNNILKHSNATRASICLSRVDNNAVLVISDNGIGHDTDEENDGVGLINISSRADLSHGHIKVESSPGKGFKLIVTLPLVIE